MTIHSLIENTVLYALGFLDDQEQAAYESALAEASAEVRAHILNEARRMSDLGELLPDEQPRPELRDLAVAAVRAAMREQEVEHRIAQMASAAPASGVVGASEASQRLGGLEADIAGRITPATRRHAQPSLNRSTRVHSVWRAAAIGLGAATIALTVVSMNMRETYDSVKDGVRIAELYDRTGAEFVDSALFDPETRRVTLTGDDLAGTGGSRGQISAVAAVWHNPDWNAARLFVKNFRVEPDSDPYRLVVLDNEGNIVREVAEFRPTGQLQDFEITVNLATESRLAIYQGIQNTADAQPMLRTIGSDI